MRSFAQCAYLFCIILIAGCTSVPPMERLTFEDRWEANKAPDTNTLLTCTQYASVASSYAREKRTPPPLQSVVKVNVTAPTEYEGEISKCTNSSCQLTLRETSASSISRSIKETSNDMAESYEQLGAAIGNAIAEGKRRRRGEKAYKDALNECYELAGFQKEQLGFVDVSLGKLNCDLQLPSQVNRDIEQEVRFTNETSSRINLLFMRKDGSKKQLKEIFPRKGVSLKLHPGSSFLVEKASDKSCLASLTVPEYKARTTVRLRN